jgi:hypothetical protein
MWTNRGIGVCSRPLCIIKTKKSELTKNDFILQRIEERKFNKNECFLCCSELNSENSTNEHVIPKWLQKKYNLWDQKLRLKNNTTFFYRNLTIPCCFTCNNKILEPLEDRVKNAHSKGIDAFQELDKSDLFLWLGKIYYGILYKELFLKWDWKSKETDSINSPEFMDSFFMHFLFLQKARINLTYENFFPASIYVFETQENEQNYWDFIDNHETLFIAIRMGNIGVISLLQDCQKSKTLEIHLNSYKEVELHPIQFRELASKILYKGLLEKHPNKFMYIENSTDGSINVIKQGSYYQDHLFNEWVDEEYAKYLAHLLGFPIEVVFSEGILYTFLKDEDGKAKHIDINMKIDYA